MVERLLLDRVDAETGRAAVGREHHRIAFALAHEARAALALVQPAVARAEVALDAPVGSAMPPAAGKVAHGRLFAQREFALRPLRHRVARNVQPRTPEIVRRAPPCASAPPGTRADRGALPRLAAGTSRGGRRTGRSRRRRPAAAARAGLLRPGRRRARRPTRATPRSTCVSNSRAASGGKRGSRNAAAIAFSRTSTPSGRRALERADAAAQLARPASASRTWPRARRARHDRRRGEARSPSSAPIAERAIDEQRAAEIERSVTVAVRFGERERRVADDARLVARRVARIAQGRAARARSPRRRAARSRPLIGVAPQACS